MARVARAARYSTDAGEDPFLTTLMKKIDALGQAKTQRKQSQRLKANLKLQQPKANPVKIFVKDHPLSSNTFKRNAEKDNGARDSRGASRFRSRDGASGGKGARGTDAGDVRGSDVGARDARPRDFGVRDARPRDARPRDAGPRGAGPRGAGGSRGNGRDREGKPLSRDNQSQGSGKSRRGANTQWGSNRGDKPAALKPQSIVPKKLVESPYKPTLGGDVFFHGKIALVGLNTSSRVAAVAKQTLVLSEYPYKLPKAIIESIDENFAGNDFLLQKDYSLDVDPQTLGQQIRCVVKGEPEVLAEAQKGPGLLPLTHGQLIRCGGLPISQKQSIYNIVAGITDPKDLFKDAAWNKSPEK